MWTFKDLQNTNFLESPLHKSSLNASTEDITAWLFTLTQKQRQSVLSFTSPYLVKSILLMVQNDELNGNHTYQFNQPSSKNLDLKFSWTESYLKKPSLQGIFIYFFPQTDKQNESDSKKNYTNDLRTIINKLLDGIRIIDNLDVYDTICLSDDLLNNLEDTFNMLDTLAEVRTKITDQKLEVYHYIVYGLEQGIQQKYLSRNLNTITQIIPNDAYSQLQNEELLEETIIQIVGEIQTDQFFQLCSKEEPFIQIQFIKEVIEFIKDQDQINLAFQTTINNYFDMRLFVVRHLIKQIFISKKQPITQPDEQQENYSEVNKIFTPKTPLEFVFHDQKSFEKEKKNRFQLQSEQTSIPDNSSDQVSQVTSIDNMPQIMGFKTPLLQDDSSSSNWQGDSVSQQHDIDNSMEQQQHLNKEIDDHIVEINKQKLQEPIVPQVKIKRKKANKQKKLTEQRDSIPQFCPYTVKMIPKPKSQKIIIVDNQQAVQTMKHRKSMGEMQKTNNKKQNLPTPITQKILEPPKILQIKLRKKKEFRPKTKAQVQENDHTKAYKKEDTGNIDQITNMLFNNSMSQELENYQSYIRSQQDKFYIARDMIVRRIQSVVRVLFRNQGADAGMFGSCATGLALPESDIDISISGFHMYPKQQLFQPMQQLLEILSQYKWVVKYKHIYTASIPILKLEIDPSISYNSCIHKNPPLYLNQEQTLNFDPLKVPSFIEINIIGRVFQVDIIFDSYSFEHQLNVAFWSTDMIIHWTRIYPGFTEITMILKYLLKKKNLNEAFLGGISSYCLAVMLAAIYQSNFNSFNRQENYVMLQHFLYKYGFDFDLNKSAVQLREHSGFIQQEDQSYSHPLAVYSPLTNQVISTGAFSAPVILQEFKNLYNALQVKKRKLSTQIQKYISPQILNTIIQERWQIKDILRQLPIDQEKAFLLNYLNSQ